MIPITAIDQPVTLGSDTDTDLQRQNNYRILWDMYRGAQWTAHPEETPKVLNYARLVIDKAVGWLVGSGFDIRTPPSPALRAVVIPFLQRHVWAKGRRSGQALLTMIAQTAAVAGDAFVLVTASEPTRRQLAINPNARPQVRLVLQESSCVRVRFDTEDPTRVIWCRIETTTTAADGSSVPFIQEIDEDTITETVGSVTTSRPNPLLEVPLVHIPNLPISPGPYGMSDLSGLIDLMRTVNERAFDAEITASAGAPMTVVEGGKTTSLSREPRTLWSLPDGAKVNNLAGLDTSPMLDYVAAMRGYVLELAETPALLLEAPPISNTSGVALALQYRAINDKCGRKAPAMEAGLARINYFALRTAQYLGILNLPFDVCENCGGRIVTVVDEETGKEHRRCYKTRDDFEFVENEDETDEDEDDTIEEVIEVKRTRRGRRRLSAKNRVPTGCVNPLPSNPFDTDVFLRPTIPKSVATEYDLYSRMIADGVTSRAWVRRKTPEIDEADYLRVAAEVEKEAEEAARRAAAEAAGQEGGES